METVRNERAAHVLQHRDARGGMQNGGTLSQKHSIPAGAGRQSPAHGHVSGDVWTKSARASAHMLRAPKGWALASSDLNGAQGRGVHLVHIHDLEQLRHYWATLDTIQRHGFVFNRGFSEQVGVALDCWRPTRGEPQALAQPEPESEPTGPLQLSLFGARA